MRELSDTSARIRRRTSLVASGRIAACTASGTRPGMANAWQFFMGYRYGIFNYPTTALGGAVTVKSFELTTP